LYYETISYIGLRNICEADGELNNHFIGFICLFFAILMRSFQLGTYNHMIFQTIESYTGYLQIQHPDYFADPQLDNAFNVDSSLIKKLNGCRYIRSFTSRINSFALVSSGDKTKGALINAIDPENEKKFSNYEERIVHYRFDANLLDSILARNNFGDKVNNKIKSLYGYSFTAISRIQADLKLDQITESKVLPILLEKCKIEGLPLTEKDSGIMVSDRLARFLKVSVGDTIIIMASGYRGTSANGLFAVRAIIKMPTLNSITSSFT
jgi:ABC-type lipoprotein release transport system permease subunit